VKAALAWSNLKILRSITSLPRLVLAGALFIMVATLLVYLPALRGGFIWDDDAYVTHNPLLTAPDGWWRIWFSTDQPSQYFPLVYSTLRIMHGLWGLDPFGYHLANVLLHCANALLAWTILRRLAIPGAWLAAALFALHPVQVETAAWITELKNTQSTCFYLLALLAWMKFANEETSGAGRFYALGLLLHALALFSKTTACTFPAAMVLVLWLRGQPVNLKRALQIAPFVLMGLAMGLVSVWWEGHVGTHKAELGLQFSFFERLLIATRAIWFYLGKLIWPVDLAFSYPRWEINPHDPEQYLWGVACVAVMVLLWWRRREWWRSVVPAVLFFVATLSPLLGFFTLYTFYYSFVADHYQYLACLGPFALFAAGLARLAEKTKPSPAMQRAVPALLLAGLGALTWQQAGAYRNLESLWRDTLAKNPTSFLAHNNLATLLAARGDREEAEVHFLRALAAKPNDGDGHFNYANQLMATGRIGEAIAHYETALKMKPGDGDIHHNLAVTLFTAKRTDESIVHFHEALRHKPGLMSAHFNLGIALESQQKTNEAVRAYREVLRLQPDSAPVRARLQALGVEP